MFDKLRRAKSFVHKTKHEEEQAEKLDLTETYHLRRKVPLAAQSHEHIYDKVVQQLKRTNLGESYSKPDVSTKEPSDDFLRRHPAYRSERNYRRKSLGETQHCKHTQHKTNGDVASNVGSRQKVLNSSDRPSMNQHDTVAFKSDGDFLLNRKGVDISYDSNKRIPAYVPGRDIRRSKSDVKDKKGIKNLFHKIFHKTTETPATSSNVALARNKRMFSSERDLGDHQRSRNRTSNSEAVNVAMKQINANSTSHSEKCDPNVSHPVTQTEIRREAPAYFRGKSFVQDSSSAVASRKRQHHQTKSNFDRNKPVYIAHRNFVEENRKLN